LLEDVELLAATTTALLSSKSNGKDDALRLKISTAIKQTTVTMPNLLSSNDL
jgi:hypothetical protein